MLREGNAHSARDWKMLLEPIVLRYDGLSISKFFRADAAFADPEVYRYVEGEGYGYAIRLPGNKVLHKAVNHLLRRPVGRPSHKPKAFYHSFRYQAGSWQKARRVVAKVEWRLGELFPRVGFIVTNLTWWSRNVVGFYNQRGTAEQWIKEGKNAVKWTRLSCREFQDNAVRLQLFVLAYNLSNFLRRLAAAEEHPALVADDVAREAGQDRLRCSDATILNSTGATVIFDSHVCRNWGTFRIPS